MWYNKNRRVVINMNQDNLNQNNINNFNIQSNNGNKNKKIIIMLTKSPSQKKKGV